MPSRSVVDVLVCSLCVVENLKYSSFPKAPIFARKVWYLEFNEQELRPHKYEVPRNHDAYKAKHCVHISHLCKYLFADHASTAQGQHNNTVASHCILSKLMFKDERTGSHVGILVMADLWLPSFRTSLSSGPSLEKKKASEAPCLS